MSSTYTLNDCILHTKTFDELTTPELYALLRIRSEVFIVEQNCVYLDPDGNDQTAIHLWLEHEGRIVATCRICPQGTKMADTSIGRVITTERGRGYGLAIMQAAIHTIAIRWPECTTVTIEAQADKQGFYEQLGFRPVSRPFMMEGLMHLKMVRTMERSTEQLAF